MRQLSLSLRATLVACALGATAFPAVAQTAHDDSAVPKAVAKKQQAEIAKGDPARWHRVENSQQARLGIQKKEIAAALAEAKNACRQGAAPERSKCMKDAQLAYQQDMAKAPRLVSKGQVAEVLEQVSPLEPGSTTAVGGSGSSGATSAGGTVPDIGQDVPREYRPLGSGDQSGASQSGSTQSGVTGKDAEAGNTATGTAPVNGSDATRPGAPPPDQAPAGKPVQQH